MVKANEDIKRGEEIFTSYGEILRNWRTFINYGFVISPNEGDVICIRLTLDESKEDFEGKKVLVTDG